MKVIQFKVISTLNNTISSPHNIKRTVKPNNKERHQKCIEYSYVHSPSYLEKGNISLYWKKDTFGQRNKL